MADNQEDPEGYVIPVHRSLIDPRLLMGVPRKPAILNGTAIASICLGLQAFWYLPVGIAIHIGMAVLSRYDPQWYDLLIRALKLKQFYRP